MSDDAIFNAFLSALRPDARADGVAAARAKAQVGNTQSIGSTAAYTLAVDLAPILRAILAELVGLRADLRRSREAPDLIAAIAEEFGPGRFTASGLLTVADDEPHGALAVALGALLSRLPELEIVNPCLWWNAQCAAIETDRHQNRTFSKKMSRGSIDGVVSLAMSVGVATKTPKPVPEYRVLVI